MTREERWLFVVGRWRAFVPFMSSAVAILLMTVPLFAPLPVLPHFGLLAVLLWALFQPGLMPPWQAFLLGILTDAALALPLGVNATLMPVLTLVLSGFEMRFGHRPFRLDWVVATVAIFLYMLLTWELLGFVMGDLPFSPLLLQAATTALAYPIAAAVAARIQRNWTPA